MQKGMKEAVMHENFAYMETKGDPKVFFSIFCRLFCTRKGFKRALLARSITGKPKRKSGAKYFA